MAKKKKKPKRPQSLRLDPTSVDFDEDAYGEEHDIDEMPLWLIEKRSLIRELLARDPKSLDADERHICEDGWQFLQATGPRDLRRLIPRLKVLSSRTYMDRVKKNSELLAKYQASVEELRALEQRIATEDRP